MLPMVVNPIMSKYKTLTLLVLLKITRAEYCNLLIIVIGLGPRRYLDGVDKVVHDFEEGLDVNLVVESDSGCVGGCVGALGGGGDSGRRVECTFVDIC